MQSRADLTPHRGRLELGIYGGGFFPSKTHEFYDYRETMQRPLDAVGPEMGLRASYFLWSGLGIEAEANLAPLDTDQGDGVLLFGARGHLVVQVPARLSPFVLAGAGIMGVRSNRQALANDLDTLLHAGAGLKLQASRWLALRLDGRYLRGPQVNSDQGTNHWAALVGVSLTLERGRPAIAAPHRPGSDSDRDGVGDGSDECPERAGNPPDGCPTSNRDGDGLLDDVNHCPLRGETVNSYEDDDGCPDDVPDRDGDGISDAVNSCIDDEDVDDFDDNDGCPDPDNDGDGVLDALDLCPARGPIEARGCPDVNRDSDGVVNRLDNCPQEAGTLGQPGRRSGSCSRGPRFASSTPCSSEAGAPGDPGARSPCLPTWLPSSAITRQSPTSRSRVTPTTRATPPPTRCCPGSAPRR